MALDLYHIHRIDLEEELDRRSWQWILARAYLLINTPESLTRKEALNRGI